MGARLNERLMTIILPLALATFNIVISVPLSDVALPSLPLKYTEANDQENESALLLLRLRRSEDAIETTDNVATKGNSRPTTPNNDSDKHHYIHTEKHNDTNAKDDDDHHVHGIHLASFQFHYVKEPLIFSVFVIVVALCKLGSYLLAKVYTLARMHSRMHARTHTHTYIHT